jgi:hypothetical protein
VGVKQYKTKNNNKTTTTTTTTKSKQQSCAFEHSFYTSSSGLEANFEVVEGSAILWG